MATPPVLLVSYNKMAAIQGWCENYLSEMWDEDVVVNGDEKDWFMKMTTREDAINCYKLMDHLISMLQDCDFIPDNSFGEAIEKTIRGMGEELTTYLTEYIIDSEGVETWAEVWDAYSTHITDLPAVPEGGFENEVDDDPSENED